VREGNTTPLHWPTAVITDIHPHQMASYEWSLRQPKGISNNPLQKFDPHHVRTVNYSVTVFGVAVRSLKYQIFVLI
jgi:hypothetical protein